MRGGSLYQNRPVWERRLSKFGKNKKWVAVDKIRKRFRTLIKNKRGIHSKRRENP